MKVYLTKFKRYSTTKVQNHTMAITTYVLGIFLGDITVGSAELGCVIFFGVEIILVRGQEYEEFFFTSNDSYLTSFFEKDICRIQPGFIRYWIPKSNCSKHFGTPFLYFAGSHLFFSKSSKRLIKKFQTLMIVGKFFIYPKQLGYLIKFALSQFFERSCNYWIQTDMSAYKRYLETGRKEDISSYMTKKYKKRKAYQVLFDSEIIQFQEIFIRL